MPSKFRIRRIFKGKLVNFIARKFAKIHAKPNHITIIGPILAIVGMILFYFSGDFVGSILLGVIIFFIMIFDGVDGALARITDNQSAFGGFFDSSIDRYTDSILILGFIFVYDPNTVFYSNFYIDLSLFIPLYLWVAISMIGFLLTSYSRSMAEKHGLQDTDIGLLGRSERLLILTISCWLFVPILGLIILAIFSNLTAIFRIIIYGKRLQKIT